ncbi:MAG: polysaccharide biosynthesis protein [Gammaproteobacteria bacterium]|nr:polysaccharide biosynthesis protein [Gammaproteobacteria bacterium]
MIQDGLHTSMKLPLRRILAALHDMSMVVVAWCLAYLTRFNFTFSAVDWGAVWQNLPYVFLIQSLVLWLAGCYRGLWRFASLPDLWNIARATILGIFAIALTLVLLSRLEGVPRTVLVFFPLWLMFLLSGSRLTYRIWKEHGLGLQPLTDRRRVLILGAGRAGEMLIRDLRRDAEYRVVGILDDMPELKGARVHGVPVLGRFDDIGRVAGQHAIDIVIIAIPSASREQMKRVVSLCESVSLPFRTVPRINDLVSGRFSINDLREVAIEDLLGREPVTLDWAAIAEGLSGRSVLVSGGGGSIGSELCRQIARLAPAKLVLIENSEYALYEIERELRKTFPQLMLEPLLGDVTDRAMLDHVFQHHRPQIVFHAAAYKHVPIIERQAREGAYNNVLGTCEIALAADRHGCGTFVMVSTDKAVNPENVMGATKRLAEIFCQNLNQRSKTHYITVRFGNVLDSAGSVVPLFREQIAAGGPVTVTHPEITRFFMTIPEASQLILQAAAMGQGGEIFVLDMGASIKICDLAEQMIRLAGKQPGEDIEIIFTGLRPGEKLYEELFHAQENLKPTKHNKILLALCRNVDWKDLNQGIDTLAQLCSLYDDEAIREQLRRLVPEMNSSSRLVAQNSNIIDFEVIQRS